MKLGRIVYLLLIALLCALTASAQISTATLSGVVTDTTGAVVPAAKVVILNTDTGISRNIDADAQGRYSVPSLAPGNYRVTVSSSGFQTEVRNGVTLSVGQEASLNVHLSVGSATQTVEVTGEAPAVDTRSSTVSGTVDTRSVAELPLNGRSFEQLSTLQPNVNVYKGGGSHGSGSKIVGAGTREEWTQYIVDGNVKAGGAGNGDSDSSGSSGHQLGVEGIREFRVITNAASAEYGQQPGAKVNVVTKSGTNSLHGSAYEYLRNSAMDARNYFDPVSTGVPPLKRNQFGASLGGPVIKDKTFFFGNYEGYRTRTSSSGNALVPDEAARAGSLPDANGVEKPVAISPLVAPLLQLYPHANGPEVTVQGKPTGTAHYFSSQLNSGREDYVLGKIDHHFSDKNFTAISYIFDNGNTNSPNNLGIVYGLDTTREQSLAIEHTTVFTPALLNVVHVGFNRYADNSSQVYLVNLPPEATLVPGAQLGQINVGGSGSGGGAVASLGGSTSTPRTDNDTIYQLDDQVSLTKGRHSLRFGGSVDNFRADNALGNYTGGQLIFSSLQTFFAATPTSVEVASPFTSFNRSWRQLFVAGYGQDDFQVRPGLTLNLGMRYETITAPNEANGKMSYLANDSDKAVTVGKTFTLKRNTWEPRVGFAWDPSNNGKMSLRGAFGIFHVEPLPAYYSLSLGKDPPFQQTATILNPPFPTTPLFANQAAFANLLPDIQGPTFVQNVPVMMQWNLTLQRDLGKGMTLTAGYVGSRGHHLPHLVEHNTSLRTICSDAQAAAGKCYAGQPYYPSKTRVNQAWGSVRRTQTDANSWYDSLPVSLTKRFSAGWQFQASYTFEKDEDEASGLLSGTNANTARTILDPLNRNRDKGLSGMQVKHNFVFSTVYQEPFFSGKKGFTGAVLKGWELGTILNVRSGEPLSPQVSTNNSQDADTGNPDRPNLVAGCSDNPLIKSVNEWFDVNCFTVPLAGTFGNLGRDTVIGPGLWEVDMALDKDFSLIPSSERFKLKFRAEAFNLFNHANWGFPTPQILAPTKGTGAPGTYITNSQITGTSTTSRQLQLALRLVF